jgi:HK97 family phage portal protein
MAPRWSASVGWEFLARSLLFEGDAFAIIKRDRAGRPIGLEPVHPWRVLNGVTDDGSRMVYRVLPEVVNGRTIGVAIDYDQDDVLHVPGFGFNGVRGMSPLRYSLRQAGAIALAQQDYAANFFANSARPDYALTTDQQLQPPKIKELQDLIDERHRLPENAHRPMLLHSGLKMSTLSISAADMQLLEQRKFSVEEIARAYGVPPFMIGHNEKTTSWGSGVAAMGIGFVRFTLRQHLNKFQDEINRKIFRTATRVAVFDTTDLEQADFASLDDVAARRGRPRRRTGHHEGQRGARGAETQARGRRRFSRRQSWRRLRFAGPTAGTCSMKNLRLLNLFRANAKRGTFKAEANTIFLYDVICGSDDEAAWYGGIGPQAFAKALSGMTGAVHLRINSPGGDVFGGVAMAQALREYKGGEIVAHVDGLAASIASIITIAADQVVMAPGSLMMIHKAWTVALGNADDLLKTAALLEKIDGTLAESYAAEGNKTAAEFADMMAQETWLTAQEAIEIGLADALSTDADENDDAALAARATWDLGAFDRAPAAPAPAKPDPAALAQAEAEKIAAAAQAAAAETERRQRMTAARLLSTAA